MFDFIFFKSSTTLYSNLDVSCVANFRAELSMGAGLAKGVELSRIFRGLSYDRVILRNMSLAPCLYN
jgi:hypothetical protein